MTVPRADLLAGSGGGGETIVPGMVLFRGAADSDALLQLIERIGSEAPFRHPMTPYGQAMSVAMTNCGPLGWVSDRTGYRYSATDPGTGRPWPALPAPVRALAIDCAARAGFPGFDPDACLVNRYAVGSRLSAHVDATEATMSHPVVSVSLGLPATFLLYGATRGGRARRVALGDGDVLVFGGPARRLYHGVGRIRAGLHPLTGAVRFNLTLRRARDG